MPAKIATKENEIEEKLRALYDLQLIDTRKDHIFSTLGELPLEVEDLENEVEAINIRLIKIREEVAEIESTISAKENSIKKCDELIKKYQKQQDSVRNNREFESLSKEIEFQELEIQLAEKRIKEFSAKVLHKNEIVQEITDKLAFAHNNHKIKLSELDKLIKGNETEQKKLDKLADTYRAKVEPRLLASYEKIRAKVNNGMAIVSIERGASSGSYFTLPPQRQLEIAQRKKIMVDEHSGRILVDEELALEEKEKMDKELGKLK